MKTLCFQIYVGTRHSLVALTFFLSTSVPICEIQIVHLSCLICRRLQHNNSSSTKKVIKFRWKKYWLLLKDALKGYNHTKFQSQKQKKPTFKNRIEINLKDKCLQKFVQILHTLIPLLRNDPGLFFFQQRSRCFRRRRSWARKLQKSKWKKNTEPNSLYMHEFYEIQMEFQKKSLEQE